jgi:hypothetical protein
MIAREKCVLASIGQIHPSIVHFWGTAPLVRIVASSTLVTEGIDSTRS